MELCDHSTAIPIRRDVLENGRLVVDVPNGDSDLDEGRLGVASGESEPIVVMSQDDQRVRFLHKNNDIFLLCLFLK